MDKSLEFLKSLNISNDYIIVGCSCGPDSMCLLNLLIENGYKTVVAHVNHNIREESKEEFSFLKNYCNTLGIIFEGIELPKLTNASESTYRQKRYTFYKELAKKYNTPFIMTAHHADDLMETVLMRLTRGSSLKGYSGFPKDYHEYEFRIIKPLIFYTKESILKYNLEHNIPYFIDKTNATDDYTRNRFRHNVIPFFKQENKSVHLKFLEYSEELERACTFIDKLVEEAYQENFKDSQIDLTKFNKLDEFIQRKELEYILKDIYRDDIDRLNKNHIEDVLSLIKKDTNFSYNLPLNVRTVREYDKLIFSSTSLESDSYEYIFTDSITLKDGSIIEKVDNTEDSSNYTIRLSIKDISLPLHIRSRKVGDVMEVKNLNGTKKVSKIMIDEKIEPSKRDTIPILVDNEDKVLWIPGVKKSKFDNEKSEKYDIILRYIKKGRN